MTWLMVVLVIQGVALLALAGYMFFWRSKQGKTVDRTPPQQQDDAAREIRRAGREFSKEVKGAAEELKKAARSNFIRFPDFPNFPDFPKFPDWSGIGTYIETTTIDLTIKQIKCRHCGVTNRLRSQSLKGARCGACGLPLEKPAAPSS